VRALLPRRGASLTLRAEGADVVATLQLQPPSVRLPDEAGAVGGTPAAAPSRGVSRQAASSATVGTAG